MEMTEQQMRERMKEIDRERNKLSLEKKEYEDYFIEKNKKELLDANKKYIGKCFVINKTKLSQNKQKYLEAFKILEILESPNERYALCIAIINGHRNTCWVEHGIQNIVIGLWTKNISRMMYDESDPDVIDFYKEITQEEFNELADKCLKNITECINS